MAGTYKTISGDTWDSIAKKCYGDEMAVTFLMQKNQKLLFDYFVFPAGVKVITPEKATQQKKTQKKTTTTKKSGASIDSLAPKLIIKPTKDMSFANK